MHAGQRLHKHSLGFRTRLLWLGGLLVVALVASACAPVGVKPWERDLLAAPQMQLNSDPISTGLDEHIYFSREASSGGRGFGGGGCGCN